MFLDKQTSLTLRSWISSLLLLKLLLSSIGFTPHLFIDFNKKVISLPLVNQLCYNINQTTPTSRRINNPTFASLHLENITKINSSNETEKEGSNSKEWFDIENRKKPQHE